MPFVRQHFLDRDDLAKRYRAGESVKALAEDLRVSRDTIHRNLVEAGVKIRGRSESMYVRMANTSPEERKRLAAAAHEAVRGRKRPAEEVRRRVLSSAKARQRNLSQMAPIEPFIWERLADRGIHGTPQLAVGTYNLDLAVPPVAVEVHEHSRQPLYIPHLCKRLEYLTDRGWHVCYLWFGYGRPVREAALDQVVSFIDLAKRNPAPKGQYRVIRGSGEIVSSTSHPDPHQRT